MIDQWLIPLAAPFIHTLYDAFLSSDKIQLEDAYKFIAVKETEEVIGRARELFECCLRL